MQFFSGVIIGFCFTVILGILIAIPAQAEGGHASSGLSAFFGELPQVGTE